MTYGFGGNEYLSPYAKRLLGKLKVTRSCEASDARDKVFAVLPLLDWEEGEFGKQRVERRRKMEEKERERRGDGDGSAQEDTSNELSNTISSITMDTNDEAVEDTNPQQDRDGIVINERYDIPTTSLFTKFSEQLIEALGLEVLKEIVTPHVLTDLPSWAIDWSTNPAFPFRGQSRRANRKLRPSTRFNDIQWRPSDTAVKPVKTWSFSSHDVEGMNGNSKGRQLHVRAIILGKVLKLGDMANIYEDSLPLTQWESLLLSTNRAHLLTVTDHAPMPDVHASWDEHNRWNISQIPPFVRALCGDKITYAPPSK